MNCRRSELNLIEYLFNLTTDNDSFIKGKEYIFRIMKNGEILELYIYKPKEKDPVEYYKIKKGYGVIELLFKYPPVIDIPPADYPYPADMTKKEAKELALKRAIKVVKFAKEQVEN